MSSLKYECYIIPFTHLLRDFSHLNLTIFFHHYLVYNPNITNYRNNLRSAQLALSYKKKRKVNREKEKREKEEEKKKMKEFKDAGGELLEADSDFDAENDFL